MCHGIFIHSFSATHCFDSSSYEVRSTCNCIPRTFGHQAHQHNQWQMQVRQSKALSLENLQMETLEPAWLNAWNWFGYHRSLFGSRCKWHTYLGAKATRGNRGKPALVVVGTVGAIPSRSISMQAFRSIVTVGRSEEANEYFNFKVQSDGPSQHTCRQDSVPFSPPTPA